MKKILALILALLMTMAIFAGCGSDAEADVATGDEAQQAECFEVSLDAFSDGCDVERFFELEVDGFEERLGLFGTQTDTKGEIVEKCLEDNGYANISVVDENNEFEGFIKYKVIETVNDSGEEIWDYERMSDELLTWEEVMNDEIYYNVTFVVKWKGVDDSVYREIYDDYVG